MNVTLWSFVTLCYFPIKNAGFVQFAITVGFIPWNPKRPVAGSFKGSTGSEVWRWRSRWQKHGGKKTCHRLCVWTQSYTYVSIKYVSICMCGSDRPVSEPGWYLAHDSVTQLWWGIQPNQVVLPHPSSKGSQIIVSSSIEAIYCSPCATQPITVVLPMQVYYYCRCQILPLIAQPSGKVSNRSRSVTQGHPKKKLGLIMIVMIAPHSTWLHPMEFPIIF